MSSFTIKPRLNQHHPKLDLFLDDNFFTAFSPILLKLKEPIYFSAPGCYEKIQDLVVSKQAYEQFNSQGYSKFFLEISDKNYLEIDTSSILVASENRKNILDFFKKQGENTNLCPLFYLDNDSFTPMKKHHYSKINKIVIKNLLSKGIDKDIFLRTMEAEDFLPNETYMLLTDPLFIKNAKISLQEELAPFAKKILLEKTKRELVCYKNTFSAFSNLDFFLHTGNSKVELDSSYLEEIKTHKQRSFIEAIKISPLFENKEELIKETLLNYLFGSPHRRIDTLVLQHIQELSEKNKQSIINEVGKITYTNDFLIELKSILKNVNQPNTTGEDIQIQGNKVIKSLNYQKRALEDFPSLISEFQPFYNEKENLEKTKYETEHPESIHLYETFIYFKDISNRVQDFFNLPPSNSQYFENEKFFFELELPEYIPVDKTVEIVNLIVEHFNEEGLVEYEKTHKKIMAKIIDIHMSVYAQNKLNYQDNNDNNNLDFKL